MYSKILVATSSFVGVFGTVLAVLSILKMTAKDIFKSITLEGIDERDDELLHQREYARLGIPLVFISWIEQTVVAFLDITYTRDFVFSIIIIVLVFFAELGIMNALNKKFRKKYKDFRAGNQEETHEDSHSWREL